MSPVSAMQRATLSCMLVAAVFAQQEPLIQPVSQFAVHGPAHVTVIPAEASGGHTEVPSILLNVPGDPSRQYVTPESRQALLEAPAPGVGHSDDLVSRPAGATRTATIEALNVLFSWHLNTLQAVQGLVEASSSVIEELGNEQREVEALHDQVAAAANHDALQAAQLIEDLSTLTAEKTAAIRSLDLHKAADISTKMTRIWNRLEGVHQRQIQELSDADALAEVMLGLQAAQAAEQQELATCLQLVASEVQGVATQLQRYAEGLTQVVGQSGQQRKDMQNKAADLGSNIAVRRQLAHLSAAALKGLTHTGHELTRVRARFQQVWQQALSTHHQESLRAAIAASAEAQLHDLTWRRDMALAVDAYAEAQATQSVIHKLQQLQNLLQADAGLPRSMTDVPADRVTSEQGGGGDHDVAHEIEPQAHDAAAPAAGGSRQGVVTTPPVGDELKAMLIQALQDYLHHLAAQRDASTTLAQLELLRQQLVLGQVSPGQVMDKLRDTRLGTA